MKPILSFSLIIVTLLTLSTAAHGGDSKKQTRLRAVKGPTGVFENRPGRMVLSHVSVEVKNVGSVTAENIRVFVTLPNGKKQKVYGPSKLGKYERAIYESSAYEYVTNDKKLTVNLNCSNCYN